MQPLNKNMERETPLRIAEEAMKMLLIVVFPEE